MCRAMAGESDFIEWLRTQQPASGRVEVPIGDDLAPPAPSPTGTIGDVGTVAVNVPSVPAATVLPSASLTWPAFTATVNVTGPLPPPPPPGGTGCSTLGAATPFRMGKPMNRRPIKPTVYVAVIEPSGLPA